MNRRLVYRVFYLIRRQCSTTNSKNVFKTKHDFSTVTAENQFDLLADVITPLWRMNYIDQLALKKKWCRHVVEKIKPFKISNSKTVIHKIVPSPTVESYRNKDEFSVRTGIDGNQKCVGFFLSSPALGDTVCVPPTKLISLKEEHILLSQVYQNVIRSSPLRACHDLHDGGFWRNLLVRSNRMGEIMVVVTVHPEGASEEEFEEAKGLVTDKLLESCPKITSLYIQACPHVRCSREQAPFILLHGEEHLCETIDDLTLRLSPDSFFQINTDAAVFLYENALRLLNVGNRSTLLDLCCGIGTCSLLASKIVRGCVGIDHVTQAIEDAKLNAELNSIKNCNFVAGKIEKKLKTLLDDMDTASDVALFLNPGRAGVNTHAIKILRSYPCVRRVAYVSCQADSQGAMKNFVNLCSSKFDNSPPFHLTDVQAVDMFPQTHHCELILLFRR